MDAFSVVILCFHMHGIGFAQLLGGRSHLLNKAIFFKSCCLCFPVRHEISADLQHCYTGVIATENNCMHIIQWGFHAIWCTCWNCQCCIWYWTEEEKIHSDFCYVESVLWFLSSDESGLYSLECRMSEQSLTKILKGIVGIEKEKLYLLVVEFRRG